MIKTLTILILAALSFASCNNFSKASKENFYGETFDTTKSISVSQLISKNSNEAVVVKGVITSSCKTEGCWLKLDDGNNGEFFVSTEEKFYLPIEEMKGKSVYVKGVTQTDTVTVERLKELAHDEGKSETDIQQITEPKIETSMIASGVKVL